MKKVLFIVFLSSFFLIMPDVYASDFDLPSIDLGDKIQETDIECNSDDSKLCYDIDFYETYIKPDDNSRVRFDHYVSPGYGYFLQPNLFQGPLPNGNHLVSNYVDTFTNSFDNNDYYYSYKGFKDKIYRAYFYFSSTYELETYTTINDTPWVFDLDTKVDDTVFNADDFTDSYNVGVLSLDTYNDKYYYALFFEFKSKMDFDNFHFYMSSEDYNNIYFGYAGTEEDERFSYQGLRFVESNSYLLSDDSNLPDYIKDQIEKIYDDSNSIREDDSIFSELNTCDALDIACHVNNIFLLIKAIFQRIGKFFLSILDIIAWVLEQLFNMLLSIFVPDLDYISIRIKGLLKFIDDKLGFISFPFEFVANFLNNFLNLSDTPVKNITVPTISLGSFGTLIHGFTFNIAEYWEKAPFAQIYNIYLIFVHFLIGFGLYKLCEKKFHEITGGGSS